MEQEEIEHEQTESAADANMQPIDDQNGRENHEEKTENE